MAAKASIHGNATETWRNCMTKHFCVAWWCWTEVSV